MVDETNAPTPELTDQQTRLLNFLQSYIKDNGYPPTVRECLPAGPWLSASAVAYQLNELTVKGRIRRGPGPRMITITDSDDTEDKHDRTIHHHR